MKKKIEKRQVMVEIQNQIDPDCSMESYGSIGEVYVTKKGDEIADPCKFHEGWWQASPTMRLRIESRDVGSHQSRRVWDKRIGGGKK